MAHVAVEQLIRSYELGVTNDELGVGNDELGVRNDECLIPRAANLLYESPKPSFYRRKERAQVYNGGCSNVLTCLAERS